MTRCSACPNVNACLPPDGPRSPYLFIGEAPGRDENRTGRVFVGKTGQEVNEHYLPLAGLRRDSVRFVNAIACWPDTAGGKLDIKRTKDRQLLETCAAHQLYPIIEREPPELLIPMGAFACAAVNPDIQLDLQHGIPTTSPWGIPVFPMFHPAQGMHEPKKMLNIRLDWDRLRLHLRGRLTLPEDLYPDPDYREVTDVAEILDLDPTSPLAGDTEITRSRDPYCFTYSQVPGTGRLIRAERGDLLSALQTKLSQWRAPILFHNWLFDRPVTRAMGLAIQDRLVVDTMVRAFHLGILPQGLKALGYRELGVTMEDFEDVVLPYSRPRVLEYFEAMALTRWPKPPEELVRDKTGAWKLYKPQSLSTKLKRFFTDVRKNPAKDIFSMWDTWEDHQADFVQACGEYPGICISHVPFELALVYACRDSDVLLRLWAVLEGMRKRVRRGPPERWRAA